MTENDLHNAIKEQDIETVRSLMNKSLNLDQTQDGVTPLVRSIINYDHQIACVLISNGANIELKCQNKTPLELAENQNDETMIKILKGGVDEYMKSKKTFYEEIPLIENDSDSEISDSELILNVSDNSDVEVDHKSTKKKKKRKGSKSKKGRHKHKNKGHSKSKKKKSHHKKSKKDKKKGKEKKKEKGKEKEKGKGKGKGKGKEKEKEKEKEKGKGKEKEKEKGGIEIELYNKLKREKEFLEIKLNKYEIEEKERKSKPKEFLLNNIINVINTKRVLITNEMVLNIEKKINLLIKEIKDNKKKDKKGNRNGDDNNPIKRWESVYNLYLQAKQDFKTERKKCEEHWNERVPIKQYNKLVLSRDAALQKYLEYINKAKESLERVINSLSKEDHKTLNEEKGTLTLINNFLLQNIDDYKEGKVFTEKYLKSTKKALERGIFELNSRSQELLNGKISTKLIEIGSHLQEQHLDFPNKVDSTVLTKLIAELIKSQNELDQLFTKLHELEKVNKSFNKLKKIYQSEISKNKQKKQKKNSKQSGSHLSLFGTKKRDLLSEKQQLESYLEYKNDPIRLVQDKNEFRIKKKTIKFELNEFKQKKKKKKSQKKILNEEKLKKLSEEKRKLTQQKLKIKMEEKKMEELHQEIFKYFPELVEMIEFMWLDSTNIVQKRSIKKNYEELVPLKVNYFKKGKKKASSNSKIKRREIPNVFKTKLIGGDGSFKVLKRYEKRSSFGLEFQNKILKLCSLNHRCIVKPETIFLDEDWLYIQTPYYEGGDLIQWISKLHEEETDLGVKIMTVQSIFQQIFHGVSYLHNHDLLHANLNPNNIMIDQDEYGEKIIKIVGIQAYDFKVDSNSSTQSSPRMHQNQNEKGNRRKDNFEDFESLNDDDDDDDDDHKSRNDGTVRYQEQYLDYYAPEIIHDKTSLGKKKKALMDFTEKSDIYALGVMLYESVFGLTAGKKRLGKFVDFEIDQDFENKELAELLIKTLNKDPNKRPNCTDCLLMHFFTSSSLKMLKDKELIKSDEKIKLVKSFLSQLMRGRKSNKIRIRRSKLIKELTYIFLDFKDPESLLFKCQTTFIGEGAIDAGGVSNELFSHYIKLIFDPNLGLFSKTDKKSVFYLPQYEPEKNHNLSFPYDKYYCFGRVILKCLIDQRPLNLQFHPLFYHVLLNQDLNEISSTSLYFWLDQISILDDKLVKSYSQTLQMDDSSQLYISYQDSQGKTVMLNNDNRIEYIIQNCKQKLYDSRKQEFKAIQDGFKIEIDKLTIQQNNKQDIQSMVDLKNYLEKLTPTELSIVICGSLKIDSEEVLKQTDFSGWRSSDKTPDYFIQFLKENNNTQSVLRRFLRLVTGLSSIPFDGFEKRITIRKHFADILNFQTCYNVIVAPEFDSYESFLVAIQNSISSMDNSVMRETYY
ncbi:ovarian-specific serine/threonine-protein kinase lok-related [Anaeramoeba flamelloides]|uniref:non-specific serine/threonine protein kinase n=1 Tax=Anaeramoeba flamelloides TaxID=1746091 RepID=A0AAV7YSF5_9EUKA|nr:ovarian-specific serine/threonine-protein kinase lok-related [Anaeramoeba flamelloides]